MLQSLGGAASRVPRKEERCAPALYGVYHCQSTDGPWHFEAASQCSWSFEHRPQMQGARHKNMRGTGMAEPDPCCTYQNTRSTHPVLFNPQCWKVIDAVKQPTCVICTAHQRRAARMPWRRPPACLYTPQHGCLPSVSAASSLAKYARGRAPASRGASCSLNFGQGVR